MVDVAKETALITKQSEILSRELQALKSSDSDQPDSKKIKLNVSNELKRSDLDSNQVLYARAAPLPFL